LAGTVAANESLMKFLEPAAKRSELARTDGAKYAPAPRGPARIESAYCAFSASAFEV
jgi:hypothetical protein